MSSQETDTALVRRHLGTRLLEGHWTPTSFGMRVSRTRFSKSCRHLVIRAIAEKLVKSALMFWDRQQTKEPMMISDNPKTQKQG